MLTPADDYPLHQTPEPMALASGERNFYDRFFFNGYAADGSVFFAAALGLYPQLNIMDASFCLTVDGKQHNLRASKHMLGDRLDLVVGPVRIEIVVPLSRVRVSIDDPENGMTANLEATARHAAVEEPRFTRHNGPRLFMDYTRATQNVSWQGEICFNGTTHKVTGWHGTRDRSWGIRPVGENDSQSGVPEMVPQFYWLWTPINFENHVLFCHTNDDGDGVAWNRRAVLQELKSGTVRHFDRFGLNVRYHDGTRRVAGLELNLTASDGAQAQVRIQTHAPLFYMQGLGYTHPEWGHGKNQGAAKTTFDSVNLDDAEASLRQGMMHFLHVQAPATVSLETQAETHEGRGVVEQLFIGPHAPSGFEDLLDGVVS